MKPTRTLWAKLRADGGTDRLGNACAAFSDHVEVPGCLFAWGSPADLAVERPDGVSIAATAHFPHGFASSLKGGLVSPDGSEWLNVIGDPRPYGPNESRGPWAMLVLLERKDG